MSKAKPFEISKQVLSRIDERLRRCKLEVHPGKTKIVYCKDEDRSRRYPTEKFDFLGYTFRPRRAMNRWGRCFIGFLPAVSNEAATKMRQTMRSWRLRLRSDQAICPLVLVGAAACGRMMGAV